MPVARELRARGKIPIVRGRRESSRAAQTARDLTVAPRVTQAVSGFDPKNTLPAIAEAQPLSHDNRRYLRITRDHLSSNVPCDCEVPRRLRGSG